MSDARDNTPGQDTIRLASPIFYEIDLFDFRNDESSPRLIANKFVYLISQFSSNGKINGRVYLGFTRNDGILYDETKGHRIMILPGDYYIFVAENPLDNFLDKIIQDICCGPIGILPGTKEVLFPGEGVKLCSKEIYVKRLFYSSFKIGDFSNRTQSIRPGVGREMIVRRYGFGRGNNRAIFLIGRMHGNEDGAEESIKIMENYIIENPSIVPVGTSVYILNPASNTNYRRIHRKDTDYSKNPDNDLSISIDPNRNFLDKDIERLEETKAIAMFTRKIAGQKWANFTIVSSHQYNNETGQRQTEGKGFVFPLYELKPSGKSAIARKSGDAKVIMKENEHYAATKDSFDLAKIFEGLVKYEYEPLWLHNLQRNDGGEMYPGEYMYFVSRLNASIRMIEYEVPQRDKEIKIDATRTGLIAFIQSLLEG